MNTSKLKYVWEDCTICFVCPVCGGEHMADSQSGPEEKDCGVTVQLVADLRVTLPGESNDPPQR